MKADLWSFPKGILQFHFKKK